MMKTKGMATICAALATAILAGSFVAGFPSAEEKAEAAPKSEKASELAVADNAFGIKLFKQLHKEGKNTFISPTSISVAMQMAAQGARGDTRTELDKAMGIDDINAAVANKNLIAELNGRTGVKLAMANSLWGDPARINLNEAYVKEAKDYFDSAVRAEDFSDPGTVKLINDWIAGKTNNLITDMLDKIPAEAVAYLINAIYFKGDWTVTFDKEKTRDAKFNLADGSSKDIKLMSRKDDMMYGEDDKAQVVKLPYGKDEKCAMWVVLPKEGTSLDALISDLNAEQISAWQKGVREREGTLKLPRFKLRYKEMLNDSLKATGIKKAFEDGAADFSHMGESRLGNIYINRVLHEAVVIVNEEGTEAAAATIVEMGARGAPPKLWNMTCDRPFLFLIQDKDTGAILFMGACHNPDNPE